MKGGKRPLGYTIIEVMIVMAVSGMMFVIAANFISGKQASTSFTQGVNETATRIQDIIAQTTNGQYSDIPVPCSFVGGAVSLSGPVQTQGKNSTCVFLGKMLHLRQKGAANDHNYEVFSLAGGRVDAADKPITSLPAANPKVIPALTTRSVIAQNLDINQVTINGVAGPHSYGIGFFQGQGAPDPVSGAPLLSGSQAVSMYYVSGLTGTMDEGQAAAQIASNLVLAQTADICVSDGTRYADVILGTNNNQLSVSVAMRGTVKPPTCP